MRVAVIITARPSYAKLKTVIAALVARGADVQIIACASALLERYGYVRGVIAKDFPQLEITDCWSTYEGANLVTSAKETGALLTELAGVLTSLRTDYGLVCADRHEVLAAAQACSYLQIPLIHLQGGERSGSVDDKVRDAITQLADIHCVSTRQAQMRVYALTGNSESVIWTGCPSIDLAKQALSEPPVTAEELGGAGKPMNLAQSFVVVLQHPVTSEAAQAYQQMGQTLDVALTCAVQVLCFWPGEDAGADAMSKAIRERHDGLHTIRSLPPVRFLRLLTHAECLIGNSSAGIREAGWLGVPAVNIGSRQTGRERGRNVVDVGHDAAAIRAAIQQQIEHGRYKGSDLYGKGDAGERIAEVIVERVGHRTSEVA